jgi:3-oxoacyl-[acyl-carrier protein] reductase
MRQRRFGRIVAISSTAARSIGSAAGAHYTAAKAGVISLARHVASEMAPFGITVNAVCPGMIDTELTRESATTDMLDKLASGFPVPRLGTAIEVADLICFTASEQAAYITGASLDINGGDLMM